MLEDPPPWLVTDLVPIPIPATLRKPHHAVERLRTDKERSGLRPAVRSRALRALNALATEAETRGHDVELVPAQRGYVHPRDHDRSILHVTVRGHEFGLRVHEPLNKVKHLPTPAELRRAEKDSWFRIPANDQVPSGHVALSVINGRPYRQSTWVDTGTEATELFLA